ncbi:IS110 family transposase [Flavobacterium sp. AG291]|uniref:IS110 family transposase n=1 Tax=Flavobacterium sp. AG291 TaxID=2184000 RepID=UPI000E0ABE16|nr:IS110 family transposase [Flavobacterium sp. AG291]RDI03323.1 transposase [Flavobacterium sp. AG291]
MKNIIVGIDISQKTLDLCIKEKEEFNHFTIDNNKKAIGAFFKHLPENNVVVAMENTGRYNWELLNVLESFNFQIYLLSPLHLKRSIGLSRGKNDIVDAFRICCFIEKNMEECKQWIPCKKSIKKIKILLTERASRSKLKRQLKAQKHDYRLMKDIGLDKKLINLNEKLIKNVEAQIKAIEKEIELIIVSDSELNQQKSFITSVPGVGKVLAWMLISKTEGFTSITDPRKMACYSGVVPFDYQSGTSIKRKPRVSNLADKTIKTTLHMAALSAVRRENDLGAYYLRKTAEGKNKMSVINAVRNKIIHRVFAVIKNQTFYQKDLVIS